MTLGGIGQHQNYVVCGAQQFFFGYITSAACFFIRFGQTTAIVINHIHTETQCAFSDALSNTPHANNTERAVMQIHAKGIIDNRPLIPMTSAHPMFRFGNTTRGCH